MIIDLVFIRIIFTHYVQPAKQGPMAPTESKANPVAEIVDSIHHFIEQRQKMAHISPDYFNFNYIAPNLLEFHPCRTNKYYLVVVILLPVTFRWNKTISCYYLLLFWQRTIHSYIFRTAIYISDHEFT
jgi:hypothetical protein